MAISTLKRTTLVLVTISVVAVAWNNRQLRKQLPMRTLITEQIPPSDGSRLLAPPDEGPDSKPELFYNEKRKKSLVRLRKRKASGQQKTTDDKEFTYNRKRERRKTYQETPSTTHDALIDQATLEESRQSEMDTTRNVPKIITGTRKDNGRKEDEKNVSMPDVRTSLDSISWLIPSEPDVAAAFRIRNTVVDNVEPLQNCLPTAQVRLIVPENGANGSPWILQSMDEFGQDKRVGGDEYYITYQQRADQEHFDLAAIQTDNNDGTYTLDFVTVPMNPHPSTLAAGGVLKVYFQFTCDLGRVPFPLKNNWKGGGSTLVVHEMADVPQAPPYREFVPPNRDGSIDFSLYHLVLSFGDSMMYQLVKTRGVPPMTNTYWHENMGSTLETRKLPHILDRLEEWHGDILRSSNETHKIALVLGSSVWDVSKNSVAQGTNFDDHIDACRQLVMTARERYPNADIYWKSASALHPHRVSPFCYESHVCNVSYQTSSRIRHLYVRQKALMKELSVPHLDVHEALYLSADYTNPGDIRHYEHAVCALVESYFYSGFDYLAWLQTDSATS